MLLTSELTPFGAVSLRSLGLFLPASCHLVGKASFLYKRGKGREGDTSNEATVSST